MSDVPEAEAVEKFITADTAAQREQAFSELVKRKKHQTAWKDPRFQASLTELARRLSEPGAGREECLANLAVLARVYSAVKASRRALALVCESSLSEAPPPLTRLRNPDDRLAVATLLLDVRNDWTASYAAYAIAHEDSAEKTRDQLTSVMLTRLDLASVLEHLTTQLERLEIGTENPADAMGRRLRRIVVSLRRRLPIHDIEAGRNVGVVLRAFLSRPFLATGNPGDDKVVRELADETLGLVHDIVRTQLALAADSDIYNATTVPKSWIAKGLWPRFIQRSKNGVTILRDLQSAILLLGRQGLSSTTLRDRLAELTGSSESAGVILKSLAAANPELPPDVRRWLETGGRTGLGTGGEGSQLAGGFGADEYVAQALLAATQLRSAAARVSLDGSGAVPEDGRDVRAIWTALMQDVERLASARGLKVRGEPGEIVQYSPHAHRVTGDSAGGVSRVRIVRPMVERASPAGATMVVVRALVEPV